MKMKDLDKMDIEKIIRLPFFHSLEKDRKQTTHFWKITFRCNRLMGDKWILLDEIFESEFVVRFKIIDPNY